MAPWSVPLLSAKNNLYISPFMGYGFAVLDERVTSQSGIRPGTDFSRLSKDVRGSLRAASPAVRKPEIKAEVL